MSHYKQLLQASFKSNDTEEWVDIHFTRKIGLLIALACRKLHIRPNTVTIISIVLGLAAAVMFYYSDVYHNIIGVLLLMTANFCDSADGQLARLTNSKSELGRILDGLAGDIWFVGIYTALCLRMTIGEGAIESIYLKIGCWLLGTVAGICCHAVQSAQADYYRQIHLWMQKGEADAPLWQQNTSMVDTKTRASWFVRIFNIGYERYSRAQQHRAPICSRLIEYLLTHPSVLTTQPEIKKAFLTGSRPLMKYTNILTFNTRAFVLYITCILNIPWLYFVFEIIILHPLYLYMVNRHERLCNEIQQMIIQLPTSETQT